MIPAADAPSAVIRADGNYFGAVRRRFAAGGLHMSETTYDAGARIPSHRHECPSFFMPLGGTFVEGCADAVRQYEPGDVGYHPPHEPHWLETRGRGARGFAVEVGTAWRDAFGAETHWDDAPRDLSRSRISWLLGRLYLELHTHDAARPLVVEALGVEIGAELDAVRTRASRRRPHWLARARALLDDRLDTTTSLATLADATGVSAVSIINAFRAHEGCTPGDYVRAARLARARRELVRSDRPLSAIALDAGFYDQSHFTRAFRAAMGVPPSEYRAAVLATIRPGGARTPRAAHAAPV